ncbi:sodium-dependent transporter [candidate division KSB3 bacterium]|uniref:Transporter n=1 Tax=candidate division KSB3 bacterium TaxID=2044937 RepID=A0A2G6EA38_9BACT|nr:MAG: sodium-dependent transporter [candidate division KSB3 bacterium]PIE31007.1 MAG: sodium-dependent transporter [candidate division KSB3 bacterium]
MPELQRDHFGSTLGILAAAAGSAIGLGNVWKFPYITGVYGGAAFIIVYLVCIALIGLPVMLSEFLIGRRADRAAIGSFKKLAPGTAWFLTGWMGVVAAFCILSFYSVVAGWTIDYIVRSIANQFAEKTPEEIKTIFGTFIGGTARPLFWHVVFMLSCALIVMSGVKKGIEKYSKILMPLLLIILIVLDIRALTLPGAGKGLAFLFQPDFSKLSAAGVLAALGHAFFSLSLGMGAMITYGSYIEKKENLGSISLQVIIADTMIALLAGIAIFPSVFAFGIEPGAGPGLVFVTLPNVFNQMPGGYIFQILFFVLLVVAALTSAISILEVVVAYFVEELNMKRHLATFVSTAAIGFIGVFASLSQGPLSTFTLPIFNRSVFDSLDFLASNILLPVGGMFVTLFVGWYLKQHIVRDEVSNGGKLSISYMPLFMILCKVVAPIGIAIVFLNGLGILKF